LPPLERASVLIFTREPSYDAPWGARSRVERARDRDRRAMRSRDPVDAPGHARPPERRRTLATHVV